MFNEPIGGACATATHATTMPTYQLSQQRLKCGEVFVWDCVGELFAIECLLCEERPLCTLSEFAEHMDIWHYDWTAEAHASLPDTTTNESCETLPTRWAAVAERISSTNNNTEFGGENIESAAYTVWEIGGEVEVAVAALAESGSCQATAVYENEQSALSRSFDIALRSATDFEETLISTTSSLGAAEVDSKLCVEKTRGNETEGMTVNSAQTDTMAVFMKKRVENPALQRLKTEKLIEIYEKFPELWHKQHKIDLKSETQAKAYRSISLELKQHGINLKPHAVQRRLNMLRKRCRLAKLEELKSHLEGQPYTTSFEFYERLRFLKEHIEPQLCKICNRICKDATKCCASSEGNMPQNGEYMHNKENKERVEEKEDAEAEKVSEKKENTEVAKNDEEIKFLQCMSSEQVSFEVAMENVAGMPPAKTLAANKLECCGNELEIEMPKIGSAYPAQTDTKTFQQNEGNLEATEIAAPTLVVPSGYHTNAEMEPMVEKRNKIRKRNKIEILEVIELPRAYNFNTQEPEVSTSTMSANVSNSPLDVVGMADEKMVSEEYDSSNGDSGILRDLDDQNEVEADNDADIIETESFARLTPDQTHKLIRLYEQYPMLWDPDHADFSTRERRRNAWRQMTSQLNSHFQMRYTWTTVHRKMHDYVKYYKRERQRIEVEGGGTRWCFYDDFAFLGQVLTEQASDAPKLLLTKQQNQKIIKVYDEYPQLWNTQHTQFKRRCLRQGLFKSMSDKLRDAHNINISPLKLKQRIVEFRCTYRIEKERRFAAEQQGEIYKPCYEYYELLNFLDPHVAPFICPKCGVQYKKHTEIERHMRKEHSNKSRRKVDSSTRTPETVPEKKAAALANVCHICGMSFTMLRNLKCHLKRHTNQRTHACAKCPKKFFDAATLRLHERSHTKSRPFICDQCGACYVSGSKLNQHIKRHSNQRDHPCELCGKAFYTAFECERHMRTHMNIREKVCPICGKDFGAGSSYYAHMLLHSDVKRYKCKMCCQQFAQFAGLYKHRRRHHPTEFAKERAKKNGGHAKDEKEETG
ncbi:uncharacterized protein LOC128859176 [Anastrepha ludens]|uniref:uncharacterized protein LOC128859176 n=1 Tax=Anastrepha ludens TaxID=28586 RepID=UPI0023B0A910|nr:uncharacterized protein LOC128859176 [Anastrepha ludens]